MLAIANDYRAQNGVPPLQLHPTLQAAAHERSRQQADREAISHDGWIGTIQAAGYAAPSAENIAAGQVSAESVMSAWWGSDGHRANILNGGSDSGVGCVIGRNGVWYWTHDFGTGG